MHGCGPGKAGHELSMRAHLGDADLRVDGGAARTVRLHVQQGQDQLREEPVGVSVLQSGLVEIAFCSELQLPLVY